MSNLFSLWHVLIAALYSIAVILELERIRIHNDAMDVEGDDRLSSLPNDVIHKILSFNSIKDAIGTSVLSSRWRFIWTTMPYLNFENLNRHGPSISIFISNVLSHHNKQIQEIKAIEDMTISTSTREILGDVAEQV
ncbi:hypothetical protein L2E82_43523 [Cichorium intybus]|uniref:Uncharacterized protein n=1 Tax=Cichorium intybus TaxID=13427 RepID=A0ACB8ZNS9_CICIN|nr:hypothetical protein L2E82_43523 [Cichorium intybus]